MNESFSCENNPVLIVGTTPDYFEKIQKKYSGRVMFLFRDQYRYDPILAGYECEPMLFGSFENIKGTLEIVLGFQTKTGINFVGVACFDCESLIMAGHIAAALGKPFPSLQAVYNSRNKIQAKSIWKKSGVETPEGLIASTVSDTMLFFRKCNNNIVLKPVSGSGSELVFHCTTELQVKDAVDVLERELPSRKGNPIFKPLINPASSSFEYDSCSSWIAEEFIPGPEFSCDFFLNNGLVEIIRTTRKLMAPDQTFGSVLAYIFPAEFPKGVTTEKIVDILVNAAGSLGFEWGHFMADFRIKNGNPVMIELTPRPGGDSIPDLVETATGWDLLGLHLDLVSGMSRTVDILKNNNEVFASVNIYCPSEGRITHIDTSEINTLPHVRSVVLKKNVGDQVFLPPSDYDNRLLGYCIVAMENIRDIATECDKLRNALAVTISHTPSI